MACAKTKRTKNMHNINDTAVQGRLSENLNFNERNYRMKYLRHEISFNTILSCMHAESASSAEGCGRARLASMLTVYCEVHRHVST